MSGETQTADPNDRPERNVDASDLTLFQHNILIALANSVERREYGLGIKRKLRGHYDEEINHGRLYQNLDELVEKGLVEKEMKDARTNWYCLTDAGLELLKKDTERRSRAVLRRQDA
jgi:DNA-binding PadR family transcriptional regulator